MQKKKLENWFGLEENMVDDLGFIDKKIWDGVRVDFIFLFCFCFWGVNECHSMTGKVAASSRVTDCRISIWRNAFMHSKKLNKPTRFPGKSF